MLIALRGLAINKLRSILTMLGIIIGVAAVIALLSVGQGFESFIADQFASLGTNLLFVVPGGFDDNGGSSRRAQPLTLGDAAALADPFQVPHLAAVAPEYSRRALVVRGQKERNISISGVTPDYETVRNFSPVMGEFISADDVQARSRVALLGATAAEELFGEDELILGQTIKINDIPFRVKGILEEKGGNAFGNEDNVVIIPITTAQRRLFSAPTVRGDYVVSVIYAQVVDEPSMDLAADEITEVIRRRHRISFRDDDDFTVISQADLIAVFGDITAIFTIVLGSIAGISLVVGGIGIMNIMLVSVTERTREIGLRKSVGAKRSDILVQFLVEAIVISLVGGAIGILLGIITSQVLAGLADLNTVITPGAILLATSSAILVGLIFGVYPATRAARLNPIDALRYE